MQIGWFGIGSGKYADADAVAEIAEAAESLGYESIWVGEHPVLIDPHEAPSPLPPHSELLDPIPVLAYAAARWGHARQHWRPLLWSRWGREWTRRAIRASG